MKRCFLKKISLLLFAFLLLINGFLFSPFRVLAAPENESADYLAEAAERKSLPVQSNEIANWPTGPEISAQAAILMEANTGAVLYAKNIHEELFPASTTKLMTCLVAAEHIPLDETVSFSHDAVFSLEPGSSNIGIDPGQSMPMEECLYGILAGSANEVSNAVAEHAAGSIDGFVDMMNEKAKELGCENTHFMNAHGLHHEQHYTSAYDLALIARAFFQNELLSRFGNTVSHHFTATANQPDDFVIRNKHKLITGEIPYDGIKGGKTGYTDDARQNLVTCAERNGMKLICVVMKEEAPDQFHDTVKLFDYGFTNFTAVNIAQNETAYTVESSGFFHDSYDIFGNSSPALSLNQSSFLILPKTVEFSDLTSEVSYQDAKEGQAAMVHYSYHGAYLGSASVDLAVPEEALPASELSASGIASPGASSPSSLNGSGQETIPSIIYINVKTVILWVLAAAALFILLTFLYDLLTNYHLIDRENGPWLRRPKNRRFGKGRSPKGPRLTFEKPSHRKQRSTRFASRSYVKKRPWGKGS